MTRECSFTQFFNANKLKTFLLLLQNNKFSTFVFVCYLKKVVHYYFNVQFKATNKKRLIQSSNYFDHFEYPHCVSDIKCELFFYILFRQKKINLLNRCLILYLIYQCQNISIENLQMRNLNNNLFRNFHLQVCQLFFSSNKCGVISYIFCNTVSTIYW